MKKLFENWQKFLTEENKTFPYQIYCDMDGVLVDFITGAVNQINADLKDEAVAGKSIDKLRRKLSELGRDQVTLQDLSKMDKKNRLQPARKYMYKRLQDNEEFWATLPLTDDGLELWAYISEFGPYILTAPMQGEGSKRGKDIWIEDHLSPKPLKVFKSHEKYSLAFDESGQPNVLIDDFEINTTPWEQAGGIAILHTSTNSTIQQLEELMKK